MYEKFAIHYLAAVEMPAGEFESSLKNIQRHVRSHPDLYMERNIFQLFFISNSAKRFSSYSQILRQNSSSFVNNFGGGLWML